MIVSAGFRDRDRSSWMWWSPPCCRYWVLFVRPLVPAITEKGLRGTSGMYGNTILCCFLCRLKKKIKNFNNVNLKILTQNVPLLSHIIRASYPWNRDPQAPRNAEAVGVPRRSRWKRPTHTTKQSTFKERWIPQEINSARQDS